MEAKKVTNWRDFLIELKGIKDLARWSFQMADSPLARPYFYMRYVATLSVVLLGLIQPFVINNIFGGIISKEINQVSVAIGILAVLIILERIAIYYVWKGHEHLYGIAQENIHRNITRRFLEKSPHQHKVLKGLNHESMAKGKNRLFDLCIDHFPEATEVLALILISYVFLWLIQPVAGAIMTLLIAVYLLWSLYLNYQVAKTCPPIEEEFTAFERHLASRWKFAERVIVSAKEGEELKELEKRWATVVKKDRGFWLWHLKQSTARDFVSVFVQIAIMTYGAKLVLSGEWQSVGLLYPLYSWTSIIVSNIWRIGSIQRSIIGYMPTLKVMMETLNVAPDVVDSPKAIALNSHGPLKIEFKGVSYRYESNTKGAGTIQNVSLTILAGQKVALVGPSGAGKSTLQYLVLRFMDPLSGSILANGKDIREITLGSWRQAIAYIPQKAQIFDGTVRDNLLYPLPPEERSLWTDEKLRKLMYLLAIDFGRRPDNENPLDIVVGREGVQLSGGQAQRLAIGSAVIKKPRFILIDEATSHLDSTTERAVLDGLTELVSGISTLVIAHRLSTVQSADKVAVIVDGSIEAEASSFRELFAISPTFKRLATDQNLAID